MNKIRINTSSITVSMILLFGEEWLQVTEKNQPTHKNIMFKRCASRSHINSMVWI